MTIITTQSRIGYSGDNVSTGFAIPFEFFLNSDITAIKTAAGGAVSTLVLGIDYTLASVGVPGGGTLNKTTALATGETMTIFLNPPIEQESHYISNAPFPAATLENDIDRQTQISQRLQDQISRALRAPDSDLGPSMLLPTASSRASTYLAFDAAGNAVPIAAPTLQGNTTAQFVSYQSTNLASIATTVQAKLQQEISVFDFMTGAQQNSVALRTIAIDVTAAFQAAIVAAAAVGGAKIKAPAGTYLTSSTVSFGDNNNICLEGDGLGATLIQPSSALGTNPVLQFGVSTGGSNMGFSKLSIICANAPHCIGVDVLGTNGFIAKEFLIQQANIGINTVGGVIQYFSDWQINQSTQYGINITGGNDQYFDRGVMSNVGYIQAQVGINVHSTGGLWLTNLDVIEQGIGFLANPISGQVVEWIFGVNVAFDTNAQGGIGIEPTGTGACYGIDFTASWSASSSGEGVFVGGSGLIDGVRLNGMRILNNQGHGIALSAGTNIANFKASNCDIAGNSAPIATWSNTVQYSTGNIVLLSGTYYIAAAASLGQSPPNAAYWTVLSYAQSSGVFVGAGISGFALQGNRIGSEDGQTNTQLYGIDVSAGSSNNYIIRDNDLRGNGTAMLDGGTGTTKHVSGNLGYNPLGSSAITVTTGAFSWTNNTGAAVAVMVVGGTVSSISVETQGTGQTSGQFIVPQGASIVVTNTVVPAMVYFGIN